MSNPAVPAVAKVSSAWGGRGESGCFTWLRLNPYPVAINSLGNLELELPEANHFGKVDKAACFVIIKLFVSLFKISKCKMMMSFEYVAQNKSTCPSSADCSSVKISGLTPGHQWSRGSSLR